MSIKIGEEVVARGQLGVVISYDSAANNYIVQIDADYVLSGIMKNDRKIVVPAEMVKKRDPQWTP